MAPLNLPPIPSDLKALTPYLQRADELTAKDPTIAYWCAYYAAQLGISTHTKDPAARAFLLTLLEMLERMKKEVGPSDAIDDEAASSAYIENFALKVFDIADNEDRKGNANRGTAKKFLAAANFLELLRTFDKDKADSAESSHEDKIRYAKWKAADIAKAIREGRRPTPGPAGADEDFEAAANPLASPSIASESAPPPITNMPMPQPSDFSGTHQEALSPHSTANWSTTPTPGTPGNSYVTPAEAGGNRRPYVSDELEGRDDAEEVMGAPNPPVPTRMHFSPSTESSSPVFTHDIPSAPSYDGDPALTHIPVAPDPSVPPPDETASHITSTPISPSRSKQSLPPPRAPQPFGVPLSEVHAIPAAAPYAFSAPTPEAATATAGAIPVELTPQIVGRAQKHCKFAISALDYEDAEQARKELRAALKLLGG